MHLGEKIRDLRIRRGLTVQQLASATGLSKGFISQVENHRTSPSLATLHDFARALETSAAYLVAEQDQGPIFVRTTERPSLAGDGNTSRVEVLSAPPRRNLELISVELPPGLAAGDARHSHAGEECLLCTEGHVRLTIGERVIELGPGDSCHYDGHQAHAIENFGATVARVLLAITPAAYGATQEPREPRPRAAARMPQAVEALR
ncbi:MAG: cupin domain-containing protein [Candidatus Eisenbacteria bacterium]|uniref:Cupin domain-containing protein n=1 Tax=Eiseniibacteriota bacterium TaxID=2212470 RepID=A0A538UEK1_UNCEI|nr:MAG: cupin domain-containing protein [Candidatus Eisenbacteria bacterium]